MWMVIYLGNRKGSHLILAAFNFLGNSSGFVSYKKGTYLYYKTRKASKNTFPILAGSLSATAISVSSPFPFLPLPFLLLPLSPPFSPSPFRRSRPGPNRPGRLAGTPTPSTPAPRRASPRMPPLRSPCQTPEPPDRCLWEGTAAMPGGPRTGPPSSPEIPGYQSPDIPRCTRGTIACTPRRGVPWGDDFPPIHTRKAANPPLSTRRIRTLPRIGSSRRRLGL